MEFFQPTDALLVVLGGLFGWLLSKLPDKWVYVIAALSVIVGILVISGGIGVGVP